MFLTAIVLTSLVLARIELVRGSNYYRHNRNSTLHSNYYYGPNVCAVEEVLSGNNGVSIYQKRNRHFQGNQQQTCRQNTIVKYECCEGFKFTYGSSGCTGVKSPKNVVETAQELGAREFVQYLRQMGLHDLLTSGGPYTIFVPTDEAFAKMDNTLRVALGSYETATEILKYHVVPRRLVTQNMSADETLNTLNNGHRLRFNKYSTKIETVNCVALMRKNRIAQNGVVHLINSVLNPNSYSNRNLVQVINQDLELTIFSKLLEMSRMHQSLKETYHTITVLAPTDHALQHLPQDQLRRIMDDESLSKVFVLKHLLPTPVCLSAVSDEHYVKSLADKHYVRFNCDKMNSVTAQGNCINNDLKLSLNGMIYGVNSVLSTEEGKSVLQIMQNSADLSEFLQIVNIAGLAQTFENFNTLTVFAPTNKAIRCMNPMELYHVRSEPGAARAFIEFHVGQEIVNSENIYDGKTVESLAHGKQLRLQCVQNEFGVEGRLLNFQTPIGYNGAVHVVDKVLYPPMISVEDLIRKNDTFSIFAKAMDMLGSSIWTSTDFCGSHNTYFLPTNYAFKKLGTVELHRILNSPTYLHKMLNNHQADRIIPSTLIKERLLYEIQTKNDIVHILNTNNKLTVNNAEIIETDIMTTNGLIHILDDLILP